MSNGILRLLYPTVVLLLVARLCSANYMPIHLSDWEDATGIQRRDNIHLDKFEPTWRAEMMYGYPADENKLLYGNWTLNAPPGLRIVMLEQFNHLTETVDCKDDRGHISLTFKSKDAFDRALGAWSFVNRKSENRFLLISNHAGCGPEDGRHPYMYEILNFGQLFSDSAIVSPI